ncbi:hypothetical protein pb186bvf_016364 [Paramecium bursaria]
MLQPINDNIQPAFIQPDYQFKLAPSAQCIYHPQFIRHFCREPNCLMPLCQECIQVHPREHSRFITSIEESLSECYSGLASQANNIVNYDCGDIISLRKDLHKMIDFFLDEILDRADNFYEEEQTQQWRIIIKKLENLKDPRECIQELIKFHLPENNAPLQLYYKGHPVLANYDALEQIRIALTQLLYANNGPILPRDLFPYDKEKRLKRRRPAPLNQVQYQIHNYSTPIRADTYSVYSPLIQSPPIHQPVVQPVVQPMQTVVPQQYIPPQVQVAPKQIIQQQPQIPQIQYKQQYFPVSQPNVVYQESPVKIPPQIINVVKSPQTIASVYQQQHPVQVQPFLAQSLLQPEYSQPYSLKKE